MGWLIALAVLAGLAILPLGAAVRYDSDGVLVQVIAGPVRFTVLPKKDKRPIEKKPKAEKKKKTGSGGKKQEKTGGSLSDFLPLVDIALDFLNDLRMKLRVNFLQLHLTMAGDDPCDLGLNYGKAWAAMGNLLPRLEEFFIIKKKDIRVACDFEAEQTVIFAGLDITITLGRILALAAVYGWRAMREWTNIQNKRKGGAVK